MQTYTTSAYNDGPKLNRTIRTEITPMGQETLVASGGITGTYVRREIDAPVTAIIAPPVQEYATAFSQGTLSPGRVVGTHIESPGGYLPGHLNHSPPTVVEARLEEGPMVETSMLTMSPVRTPSMLRMTSSPMRKPLTTTRTCFEPGFTVTEELPSNPHAPPIPLPGETIAVTVATGREGIHTRTVDDFGVFTETVANRKSPVRTYTTTIYEEGEPPRTYTTTFQDPLITAPISAPHEPIAPAVQIPPTRFAGGRTFVSSTEAALPVQINDGIQGRVDFGSLGVSQSIADVGPIGHQEINVQNRPFGHHERSISSTPYGVQERRVDTSAFGHHEASIHSTPYGHQETRIDSTPFGQQETVIEQNAFGRRKATVTHSPGRLDQSITASQKIAEAPVMTYY